jgi:hypothetical protein
MGFAQEFAPAQKIDRLHKKCGEGDFAAKTNRLASSQEDRP